MVDFSFRVEILVVGVDSLHLVGVLKVYYFIECSKVVEMLASPSLVDYW